MSSLTAQAEVHPIDVIAQYPIKERGHPWQQLVTVVIAVPFAFFIYSLARNERMKWDVVWDYLFSKPILHGVLQTIMLTVISMVAACVLGMIVAVARMSSSRGLRWLAMGYTDLLRATPLLVQLIFWYSLGALWPRIGIDLPFSSIQATVETNSLIGAFTASILGLALHESAVMGEVIRGGILSVDHGQREAALAIGIPEMRILRKIILPQAMRSIIPTTGNELISTLKATSLVAVISGGDLLTATQNIYAVNFLVIPLLTVATIWYVVMTTIAGVGQRYVEHYYARGFHR